MKKFILILLPLVMAIAPVTVQAEPEHDTVETTLSGVTISVNGSQIHVTGANGEKLEVFNVTGTKITSVNIDSDDKSFNLNLTKGCYLLKVGKVVRKISIR